DGRKHQTVSVSPVVHVRGLPKSVVEADLVEVLTKFGTIWLHFAAVHRSQLSLHAFQWQKQRFCTCFPATTSRWRPRGGAAVSHCKSMGSLTSMEIPQRRPRGTGWQPSKPQTAKADTMSLKRV
ncbi:hypothetical protein FKM82_022393, partial [Ascaphus truei]